MSQPRRALDPHPARLTGDRRGQPSVGPTRSSQSPRSAQRGNATDQAAKPRLHIRRTDRRSRHRSDARPQPALERVCLPGPIRRLPGTSRRHGRRPLPALATRRHRGMGEGSELVRSQSAIHRQTVRNVENRREQKPQVVHRIRPVAAGHGPVPGRSPFAN